MSKKYFYLLFLLIIFIGGVFWIFKSFFENKPSIYDCIPIKSEIIASVQVNSLVGILTSEFLKNPTGLLELKNKFDNNQKSTLFKSFYTNNVLDNSHNPIFFKLDSSYNLLVQITNIQNLEKSLIPFLESYGFKKHKPQGYYSDSINVSLNYDKHKLLISFNPNLSTWGIINNSKQCFSINDLKIESVIKPKNHITVIWFNNKKQYTTGANFTKSKIITTITTNCNDSLFKPSGLATYKTVNSLANLSMHLNKEIAKNIIPDFLNSKIESLLSITNLKTKPLYQNWNGSFILCLNSPVKIKKEYKTYSYNDNFEKVEKIKYITESIPSFNFKIGTISNEYFSFLKQSGNITQDSIFTPIPIYTTIVQKKGTNIEFKSKGATLLKETSNKSTTLKGFLNVKLYIEKYGIPKKITDYENAFSSLESLNINGSQHKQQIKITTEVDFLNKQMNSLISLIKLLI